MGRLSKKPQTIQFFNRSTVKARPLHAPYVGGLTTGVSFMGPGWDGSVPIEPNLLASTLGRPVSDAYSWIEVMRYPTPLSWPNEGMDGYGCCFYPTPGSGIWLPTNRTIILELKYAWHAMERNRAEARGFELGLNKSIIPPFALPGGDTDLLGRYLSMRGLLAETTLVANATARDRAMPAAYKKLTSELGLTRLGSWSCYDCLLPPLAHALNFDTAQVMYPYPEIVVTTSDCMRSNKRIKVCPPASLGLRRGWHQKLPCNCNSHSFSLNCHRNRETL